MTKLIQIEDEDLRKEILKLRKKIENEPDKKKYTKEEFVVMDEAFKAITRKYPPSGCGGCEIVFKILKNWFTYNYDRIPKNLPKKPLVKLTGKKKPKAEVVAKKIATPKVEAKVEPKQDAAIKGPELTEEALKKLHRSVLMKMCKDATPNIPVKNTDKKAELIDKLLTNG